MLLSSGDSMVACMLVTLVSNSRSALDQGILISQVIQLLTSILFVERTYFTLVSGYTRHTRNIIDLSNISLVVKPYIVMRRTTPHADATAQECDGTRRRYHNINCVGQHRTNNSGACHEENLLPHLNDS